MVVSTERALSHPRRVEILDYLMRKGNGTGTRQTELVRALDLSEIELKYHLLVLDDAELIAQVEGRGRRGPERSYNAAASADL